MRQPKKKLLDAVKKSAERALRRDAKTTTCIAIFQPKAPAQLARFKDKR